MHSFTHIFSYAYQPAMPIYMYYGKSYIMSTFFSSQPPAALATFEWKTKNYTHTKTEKKGSLSCEKKVKNFAALR